MPPVPLDRLGRVSSNHQRKIREQASIADAALSIVDHLQPLDSGRVWENFFLHTHTSPDLLFLIWFELLDFIHPPHFIVVYRRCLQIFCRFCVGSSVAPSGGQGFNNSGISGLVMGPGFVKLANFCDILN